MSESEGQIPAVAFSVAGSVGLARPDLIPLVTLEIKFELLRFEAGQPGLPMAMQLTPGVRFKLIHRGGQPFSSQLPGQGWTDALVSLLQSLA